jgi:hypothetical protein
MGYLDKSVVRRKFIFENVHNEEFFIYSEIFLFFFIGGVLHL